MWENRYYDDAVGCFAAAVTYFLPPPSTHLRISKDGRGGKFPPTHTPSFPTPLEIETAPSEKTDNFYLFFTKRRCIFLLFKEIMANIYTPFQLTLQSPVDLLGRCEI